MSTEEADAAEDAEAVERDVLSPRTRQALQDAGLSEWEILQAERTARVQRYTSVV